MTVAMSRARLGLYILGRREVFEACPELRPAFDVLLARPDKLMLTTGEMFPTARPLLEDDNAAVEGEVAMESVEHLGKYVYEMTGTSMQQYERERGVPMDGEVIAEEQEEDGDEDVEGEGDEDEETPLEPDILEVREGES